VISEQKILLGYLHGLWGIKGWLKVFSYTSPRSHIGDYPLWWVGRSESTSRPQQVEKWLHRGDGIVVKLKGIDDRTEAALHLRSRIWIEPDQLSALPEGEYYWFQLIGLQVVNLEGCPLGKITGLLETGANDVLVVAGDRERLIPYVKDQIIKNIDLQAQELLVDWAFDF
jgi:16S rRNA processing protein RimM